MTELSVSDQNVEVGKSSFIDETHSRRPGWKVQQQDTSADRFGYSTACCSSEDEAIQSDEERQRNHTIEYQIERAVEGSSTPRNCHQQLDTSLQQLPSTGVFPSASTLSETDHLYFHPSSAPWMNPRIKIDGPEVFRGKSGGYKYCGGFLNVRVTRFCIHRNYSRFPWSCVFDRIWLKYGEGG